MGGKFKISQIMAKGRTSTKMMAMTITQYHSSLRIQVKLPPLTIKQFLCFTFISAYLLLLHVAIIKVINLFKTSHVRKENLKKLFFTIGIFLIFIGAIFSVNYNSTKTMRKIEIVKKEYETWEISANLTAGDHIRVVCYPGKNWDKPGGWDIDDIIPVNHRHIWFEIVDPNGRITEYNTAWTSTGLGGEQIPFSRCFINVTVRDGIEVEEQYPTYIGGTVKFNGTYTVRIARDEYGNPIIEPPPAPQYEPGPPAYFAIEKEYPVKVYPYTYLLPTGVSLSFIGILISAWSMKKPKKRKTRERQQQRKYLNV